MRQIAGGIAAAHGVTVDVIFNTEFIETINSTDPTNAVIRSARNAGLEAIGDRQPMSFSEDFAHFNAMVPGCFMLVGNGVDGANAKPLHASDYDFNDELLPIGASLWAELVRDRLPVNGGSLASRVSLLACMNFAIDWTPLTSTSP